MCGQYVYTVVFPVLFFTCTCFLEDRVKVHIALVKGHGVAMLQSLQSRAEQTFSSMEACSQERHLAEMKRYSVASCMIWHDGAMCM